MVKASLKDQQFSKNTSENLNISSSLCPTALIPVTTCIKTDPSWFDYCDKEEAIEYVNAGDKVMPHANQELPGFGNQSRGSCCLFKAHKA